MKAIKAAIMDHASHYKPQPDWWTKEGGWVGGGAPSSEASYIFDQHKTHLLVHDRCASRFLEASPLKAQGLRQPSPLTA
jgi:hypothetical protein